MSGDKGRGAQAHIPSPCLSIRNFFLSGAGGWLRWAPSSGGSSQDFIGGAYGGVTVHLVSRVERLPPNTCQGATARSVKQAGAQAQHTHECARHCTYERGT